jgi:hypothetical protein
MKKFLLISGATIRNKIRWAKQHLYALLILSPLVLGISYYTLVKLAKNSYEWQPSSWLIIMVGILIEAAIIGFSLSQTRSEVYHVRNAESILDSLPISDNLHLHTALAIRLFLTALIGLIILFIRPLFNQQFSGLTFIAWFMFAALTALAEIWATINWIHWRHTKNIFIAISSALLLLIASVLGGLLIINIIKPSILPVQPAWLYLSSIVAITLLYLLVNKCHSLWRAHDIEYAKRLQPGDRRSIKGFYLLEKYLGRAVAVHLFRDILLTLRAFSFAVYIVIGMSCLWVLVMLVVLTTDILPSAEPSTGWFDATWLPEVFAVKVTCLLVSTSMATLLPIIVSYELPHLWLERTSGVAGQHIWLGKLWYTRIITLPAPLLVWLASLVTGQIPMFYIAPLLLECLGIWWIVSTLIGSLSFEIPARSGIAIIIMVKIGLGIGGLVCWLWPLSFVLYAFSINALTERGYVRTRYYMITEAD